MGTRGKDKFHEYQPKGTKKSGKADKPRGGGGGSHSSPGNVLQPKEPTNKCAEPIENVNLEEVERSSYYQVHHRVPNQGVVVLVGTTLVQGRISVTTDNGEVVGYLPVEFSYLRRCIEQGFSYSGTVVSSALKPFAQVRVSLSGQQQ
jgi:hypothetical protein